MAVIAMPESTMLRGMVFLRVVDFLADHRRDFESRKRKTQR